MPQISDISLHPQRSGFMNHNGTYKPVSIYWLTPSAHVTARAVAEIDASCAPCQAWLDQLDVIHESSYSDAWM